jgi:murein DD-endopeptidase MepM/ murein hydrolase activator NlpD
LRRAQRIIGPFMIAAAIATTAGAGAGAAKPAGDGFRLGNATVTPGHPLFDGKRKIRLHYRFEARRSTDLRLEVVRLRSGNVVRSWTERGAVPGRKLDRAWDGLTRRGKAAPDGRYEFRVGPAGKEPHRAARLKLRGHVFPVDGPHGTRGAIGEFGAPRNGGRIHEGFDITGDCGTPLLAARGGIVAKTGYDPALYGNYVLIDGAKTSQDTFYAHLIAPSPLHDGERVRTAEELGRIGQTGNAAGTPCHLHFEIRVHGKPIDPEPSLRRWDRYS